MFRRIPKTLILLLIAGCYAGSTCAQTAEDSIKTIINNMFTGMKESDTGLVRSAFHENAILQTFGRSKEGKTILTSETASDFVKIVSTIPKGAADEQITFGSIKIDGPMASVWTPYKFYFNGKFSHCGVNSFHLVRLNNIWKIQYLIDTRRKANCE
jgi:Putative lumazine-binding